MTVAEAVAALDAIDGKDPEVAHYDADMIVLALCSVKVRAAYERCVNRAKWWAYA